ncbi:hypothetical_protein [Candidozyma auris]|uniref:hypothetical_protein n=1 Tax=Candidozyma auris TaxID=498019 RepID=UPI000D2951AB|nr:hypothetical_protein [[Candida] auris]QEO24426.1 hypothetical_protein [[Candida] auris]GBL52330.1 hypothetical protein CAJCM15448_46040 [[Candida] auris]
MDPQVPFLAKAKVSWSGEEEGDLGFLENEIIKVFHIVDESWWQGSLSRNGNEGIFPKEFVNIVVDSRSNSQVPTPTKTGQQRSRASRETTPVPMSKSPYVNSTSSKLYQGKRASQSFSPMTTPTKAKATPTKSSPGASYAYKMSPASKSAPQLYADHSFDQKRSPNPKLYSQYVMNSGISRDSTDYKRHSMVDLKHTNDLRNAVPVDDYTEDDDLLESISYKKQQLEKELMNLKRLERSHVQQKQRQSLSVESSFVSEDLLSSRRNYNSKDDLGAKLALVDEPELVDDEEDDVSAPPPPPPPKHKASVSIPFAPEDFRASGASNLQADQSWRQSQNEQLKLSLKSLQSDVLNLSELSATSAGSFMRHKYEREMNDNENRMSRLSITEDPAETPSDVMNSVFKDKKSKHPKIFKMLMKKKPEQNLMEQRLEQSQPDDWQSFKVDLNRMNTLTSQDKQLRTKRAVRKEPNFIARPLDFVTDINESETFGPDQHLPPQKNMKVNMRKVADFSERYSYSFDFNDLISDISVKFGTWRPNEIRAVLLHLCKFRIIEESERISQAKPKLSEVMAKGEATIFQLNYLFKKLLEALRIPSEVVLGFWKKPNEFYHNEQYVVNHCWLSVMVETDIYGNGSFRIIDLMCFKNGSICNKEGFNEFYFLAEPLDLVSTHIPSVIELQHVCPPVDLNIAYHLPRMYSGWSKNSLVFKNFNNALTRIRDLEFFEADILIPTNVELFTLIKTSRATSNDYTLCQIYWSGGKRIAKVKAVLPDKEEVGVLQIFAGAKGLQTHFDNIHELACVIPLYHSGSQKPCKLVPRFPTNQAQNNDLYIKHPQLHNIRVGHAYNFEIEVHPSMGLNSGSGIMNQDFKLVIESPSGKYTRLVHDEPHKPYGTFRTNMNCQENGTYRALVIGDSGNSWYVFAQWECAGSH